LISVLEWDHATQNYVQTWYPAFHDAMRLSNDNNPLSFPSSISTVKCWQTLLVDLAADLLEQKRSHRCIKFKDKKPLKKKCIYYLHGWEKLPLRARHLVSVASPYSQTSGFFPVDASYF